MPGVVGQYVKELNEEMRDEAQGDLLSLLEHRHPSPREYETVGKTDTQIASRDQEFEREWRGNQAAAERDYRALRRAHPEIDDRQLLETYKRGGEGKSTPEKVKEHRHHREYTCAE